MVKKNSKTCFFLAFSFSSFFFSNCWWLQRQVGTWTRIHWWRILACVSIHHFDANSVLQMLHLNGFFPSWIAATCPIMPCFVVNLASQMLHLNGCLPSWNVFMWYLTPYLDAKVRLQRWYWQLKGFFLSATWLKNFFFCSATWTFILRCRIWVAFAFREPAGVLKPAGAPVVIIGPPGEPRRVTTPLGLGKNQQSLRSCESARQRKHFHVFTKTLALERCFRAWAI